MELEHKVKQLRERIRTLRATLELEHTSDDTSSSSSSNSEPSASELYKARLMGKRST